MRYRAALKFGTHTDISTLPADPAKNQKELIQKTTEWVRKHPNPFNPFRRSKK